MCALGEFRFQTGSIKRDRKVFEIAAINCFDSKMVRLKVQKNLCGEADGWKSFDSKMVRLKAKFRVRRAVKFERFDSKMVRLKDVSRKIL